MKNRPVHAPDRRTFFRRMADACPLDVSTYRRNPHGDF